MIGNALMELVNNRDLWNRVGLPRDEFYKLIYAASNNRLTLESMKQRDAIRLLESATQLAVELLDNNKKIHQAEEILRELKTAEEELTKRVFKRLSFDDQRERLRLLARKRTLCKRVCSYYRAMGVTISENECDYGYALGLQHTTELKYIEPKYTLIRQNLLELRQLMPDLPDKN